MAAEPAQLLSVSGFTDGVAGHVREGRQQGGERPAAVEIAFFSSAVISLNARPSPSSGTNSGS